jgi:hypothetical protein
MADEPSQTSVTPATPAAQPAPFDLVRELERLREIERKRRRVTFAIGAGLVFLFAVALVQFLGTLTACKLLYEARRESARVHRETAEYLDQIHAIQELAQRARPPAPADQAKTTPAKEPVPFPDATGDPSQMKREVLADPALLVGFRVGIGRDENNHMYVASLQPIYLTDQGETLGAPRGKEPSLVIHYKAKKGYAVGGIGVQPSGRLRMFLKYMRIGPKFLDTADSYQDEWIGDTDGPTYRTLGGDGRPIVGILTGLGRTGELDGFGVVRVNSPAVLDPTEPAKEAPTDLDALLGEIRKAIQENRLTP